MPSSGKSSLPSASWKQGFARYAYDSPHPELWKGMVGALVMELGPTGSTIYDVSGFKHDGVVGSSSSLSGDWILHDGQYVFVTRGDSTPGDVVLIPSVALDGSNGMSVVALFYWDNSPDETSFEHIVGKRDGAAFSWQFRVRDGAGDVLSFLPSTGGGLDADAVIVGERHHAVATFDGDEVIIYQQGESTASSTGNTIVDQDIQISLGRRENDSNKFAGKFVHVLFYNRPLAAAEVSKLYDLSEERGGGIFQLKQRMFGNAQAGIVSVNLASETDTAFVVTPIQAGGLLFQHPGMTGRMQDLVGGMKA